MSSLSVCKLLIKSPCLFPIGIILLEKYHSKCACSEYAYDIDEEFTVGGFFFIHEEDGALGFFFWNWRIIRSSWWFWLRSICGLGLIDSSVISFIFLCVVTTFILTISTLPRILVTISMLITLRYHLLFHRIKLSWIIAIISTCPFVFNTNWLIVLVFFFRWLFFDTVICKFVLLVAEDRLEWFVLHCLWWYNFSTCFFLFAVTAILGRQPIPRLLNTNEANPELIQVIYTIVSSVKRYSQDPLVLVYLLLLRPDHHVALLRFFVVIEVVSALQEDPMLSLLHGLTTELNFVTLIIALCIAKLGFDAAVNVILIINPIRTRLGRPTHFVVERLNVCVITRIQGWTLGYTVVVRCSFIVCGALWASAVIGFCQAANFQGQNGEVDIIDVVALAYQSAAASACDSRGFALSICLWKLIFKLCKINSGHKNVWACRIKSDICGNCLQIGWRPDLIPLLYGSQRTWIVRRHQNLVQRQWPFELRIIFKPEYAIFLVGIFIVLPGAIPAFFNKFDILAAELNFAFSVFWW